ncbi:hypothetical protein GN244_ATG09129 [Phytophthora infestans]|uniref:Uncharacterized protein n=1 Tax=Phytophthora infestans TaxID=4787 RepID=A0A833SRM8_PHYIN|nr:hypothetical protein GN244_ATG09129 [Phytophthora infestans]
MNGTDFAWKTIVVEEAELAKIAGNADGGQALPLESAAKWKDYELCGRWIEWGLRRVTKDERKTNESRKANEERGTKAVTDAPLY